MRWDDSSYLKMAAIFGTAGALLCAAFSATLPDRFVSTATMAGPAGKSADYVARTAQRVLSQPSLTGLSPAIICMNVINSHPRTPFRECAGPYASET